MFVSLSGRLTIKYVVILRRVELANMSFNRQTQKKTYMICEKYCHNEIIE